MGTEFSAFAPALGYLYQARYALYLLLDASEEAELSLERFDDVAFEKDGTPQELLQLKHHSTPASLTDYSSDLWKSLRIWATLVSENKVKLPGVMLTLITTGLAPESSIACQLRPQQGRNVADIRKKLLGVAETSKNQELKSAFDAFKGLSKKEQEALISSIQVLDRSSTIVDTSALIQRKLITVRREFIQPVYERLEGWWFIKIVKHLSSNAESPITRYEVQEKLADIAEQFRSDNLPIDFLEAEMTASVRATYDNRVFVLQLREIMLSNKRLEKAILDYYKAFEQRAKWAREDLLIDGEMERYEKRLIDEWERFCDMCLDGEDISSDENCRFIGRKIFNWMDMVADFPVRPMVREPYVMRGSFHILADRQPPKVWWHAQFIDRLGTLLSTSGA